MLDLQVGELYINDDSINFRDCMITEVLEKGTNWYNVRVINPGTSKTPSRKLNEIFTFGFDSDQHKAMHLYVEETPQEVEITPVSFNDLLGG